MVYFSSDFHLGHKAICKYRTKFKTPNEHDEYIFELIEKLDKRDVLYVIGDFLFDGEHYEKYIKRLDNIKCRIKLVMGNHDSRKLYNLKENSRIELQLPLFSYKNMWVSHCPIHPGEIRNKFGCVHGHLHLSKVQKDGFWWEKPEKKSEDDKRYFNVNLDVNDYQFVKLDTIKEYFNNKKQ